MQEARILVVGQVIDSSGMSDFKYTKYGTIQGFTFRNIVYRYCVNSILPAYYEFDKYLDFIASNPKLELKTLIPFTFKPANTGDKITVYKREVSTDFNNVCWLTYTFSHVVGRSYGDYQDIPLPVDAELVDDPNSCVHQWEVAKEFYDDFIHKAKENHDSDYAELLADLQQSIESIEENIFSKLDSNVNYQPYIVAQRELWRNGTTYDFSQKDMYGRLLSSLHYFSLYFQSYQNTFGDDHTLVFIYLASIFKPDVFKDLLLSIKMDMLARLATRSLYNWQIFYNPLDDQSVVVSILESIDVADADSFLSSMIDTKGKYVNDAIHLFKSLYDGLNNSHFGIGKSNLHDFVFVMYKIWTLSSYNPYQGGVFNQSNLNKYTYNRLLGCSPDEDGFWGSLGLTFRSLNFNAAPFMLNYTSSEFIGYYLDNFSFYFSNDDGGSQEASDFSYDMRFFDNTFPPSNKILAVADDYRGSGSKGLYGTYDYYQPVALLDANQQAIMKIPVIGGQDQAIVDGHPENINNLIPIFVLKYIDDTGDVSDVLTSIGYFVDILSFVLGGYAVVSKLRYIHELSGFTSAIIEGSEAGQTTLLALYATTATEVINLSAATVSFLLKLTADANKTKPWYNTLLKTVTWIELCTAGGSVLSERLLKSSAKSLVTEFSALPEWPAEFANDARGAVARATLEEISGINLDVLLKDFKDRVKAKLVSLFSKENPSAFSLTDASGVPLHSEEVLTSLMEMAYNGKVSVSDISGIIHISYKLDKLINSEQLLLQVKYFINVTKVKGFPAGFAALEAYEKFCTDIREFWSTALAKLGDAHGIDFRSIEYEFKIQGSVTRKRLPSDPIPAGVDLSEYAGIDAPNDIEYGIFMDEENFNLFRERFTKLIEILKPTGNRKKSLNGALSYALKNDVINYKPFKYIEIEYAEGNVVNVLKAMRDKGYPNLTGFTLGDPAQDYLNFAFIKNGSRLDLGPFIPFKYK